MATSEKINIRITGDSKDFTNSVKQAQGSLTTMGNVMKGLAIGGGIALLREGFRALNQVIDKSIQVIKECVDAAAEEEVQITKLNTALKSTGIYTDEVSNSLIEYARAQQQVTEYSDDSVVAVEAMLATFKLSEEEIKVATQAVLDLASATGQDLQSAAILLGKAMVGETGMLKRYGIMVDENKYAAEGWKAVIDEINVEFGGQALAKGETYAGMLARMKNNVEDLKEIIGNAFLPVLKEMMDRFTKGGGFEKLQEWAEKAADKIREFLDIIIKADYSKVIDGLEAIARNVGVLIGDKGFDSLSESYQGFVDGAGKSLVILSKLSGFIKVIADSLALSWRSYVLIGTALDFKKPTEAWENWKESVSGIGAGFKVAFGDIEEPLDNVNQRFDATAGAFANIAKEGDKAVDSFEGISGAAEEAEQEIANLTDTMFKLFNINQSVTESEEKYKKIIEDKTSTIFDQQDALESYMESVEESIESETTSAEKKLELINLYGELGETAVENGMIERAELELTMQKYKDIAATANTKIRGEALNAFLEHRREVEENTKKLQFFQDEINKVHGFNISSTHTITTIHVEEFRNVHGGYEYKGGAHQSGGSIKDSMFSSDLNIPLVKGEAVLPASLVRAIKEGKGSFAGLDTQAGQGSVTNYFNISELVVREEADINRIAQDLYNMQQTTLTGLGIR